MWKIVSANDSIWLLNNKGSGYRDEVKNINYLRNSSLPKTLDETYVNKLTQHIKENGIGNNYTSIEETNKGPLLIDGHHFLEAASRVGIKELPTRIYENTPEGHKSAIKGLVESDKNKKNGLSRLDDY